MRYFRSFRTCRRQSRANSVTAGLASDGKDENKVAAQQVSYIIAGGKKAKMEILVYLNWQGKPLVSYETVINLIGATRTATGLRVKAKLDTRLYEGCKGGFAPCADRLRYPRGARVRLEQVVRPEYAR